MTTIEKLNEILGHVLACDSTLRRAEQLSEDADLRSTIRQLREACDVNCVNLAEAVNVLGGLPNRVPSPRFTLKLHGESIGDTLDLAKAAQWHVLGEIDALLDDPAVRSLRETLCQVRMENARLCDRIRGLLI
jgi:hypothetical protein